MVLDTALAAKQTAVALAAFQGADRDAAAWRSDLLTAGATVDRVPLAQPRGVNVPGHPVAKRPIPFLEIHW
jgi:hypothetical protein